MLSILKYNSIDKQSLVKIIIIDGWVRKQKFISLGSSINARRNSGKNKLPRRPQPNVQKQAIAGVFEDFSAHNGQNEQWSRRRWRKLPQHWPRNRERWEMCQTHSLTQVLQRRVHATELRTGLNWSEENRAEKIERGLNEREGTSSQQSDEAIQTDPQV